MVIKELIEHLENESSHYKELIKTLQDETAFLVNRDYKGLYETASRKEHLLLRIQSMGPGRTQLLNEAANSLGVTSGEINMSAIVGKLGPERGAELGAIQSTILSLIETVKELNQLNSLVIKGSLENVTKALGFLGSFSNSGTYGPAGAFSGPSVKGSQLREGA